MRITKINNPTPLRRFMRENGIAVKDIEKELTVSQSTVSTWLKKDENDEFEELPLKFFMALSYLSDKTLNELFYNLIVFRAEYQTLDFDERLYKQLYIEEDKRDD